MQIDPHLCCKNIFPHYVAQFGEVYCAQLNYVDIYIRSPFYNFYNVYIHLLFDFLIYKNICMYNIYKFDPLSVWKAFYKALIMMR